jgi:hypothetical protein
MFSDYLLCTNNDWNQIELNLIWRSYKFKYKTDCVIYKNYTIVFTEIFHSDVHFFHNQFVNKCANDFSPQKFCKLVLTISLGNKLLATFCLQYLLEAKYTINYPAVNRLIELLDLRNKTWSSNYKYLKMFDTFKIKDLGL